MVEIFAILEFESSPHLELVNTLHPLLKVSASGSISSCSVYFSGGWWWWKGLLSSKHELLEKIWVFVLQSCWLWTTVIPWVCSTSILGDLVLLPFLPLQGQREELSRRGRLDLPPCSQDALHAHRSASPLWAVGKGESPTSLHIKGCLKAEGQWSLGNVNITQHSSCSTRMTRELGTHGQSQDKIPLPRPPHRNPLCTHLVSCDS